MVIRGADLLAMLIAGGGFTAKMVFNSNGALIFPVTEEHRQQKLPGISYEDEYKGNALAAMISPSRIDIRFHRAFADSNVAALIDSLLAQPELSLIKDWAVTYQGRRLSNSRRRALPPCNTASARCF